MPRKAPKRVPSAIGILQGWEKSFGKLDRSARAIDEHIENAKKIWTDWIGPSGEQRGGRLTKKMARDFLEYLKAKMLSQEAFERMVPLSRDYFLQKVNIVRRRGYPYSPEMIGFLSGTLFENLSMKDQGYGKFTIGIHHDAPEKVAEYAEYLERGTRKQPPRPFMGKTFRDWLEDRYPDYADDLIKRMNRELKELARAANTHARNLPDKYNLAKVSKEDIL